VLSGLSCATRFATCTLPGLGAAFMHRPAWKVFSEDEMRRPTPQIRSTLWVCKGYTGSH
jgi:hypothetical protein